jgi:exosortase/archaeosortase family protein
MQNSPKKNERYANLFKRSIPVLSFVIPFIILYFFGTIASINGPSVFDMTWKGRLFYIFFLWLVLMELILAWDKLRTKLAKVKSSQTMALILVVLLPTLYVVLTNFYGGNALIVNFASNNKIPLAPWMPLSTEYLVFAVLFALIILAEFGPIGLKSFSISASFLAVIGIIYTIDNVYPYGSFSPFQIIVPTTARLAADVLGLMGYHTSWLGIQSGMPVLEASGSQGSAAFGIAWPCSGVESLLIYTVIILLFLKSSAFSWKQRVGYFIIGAVVTYFINVLRIVTIFVIAINGGDYLAFHNIYGQLYSITWIVSYPLLIIGSQMLWAKIKSRDTKN